MIDISINTDNFALYDYTGTKRKLGKENFKYIFHDNLNFFRYLYDIGKLRPTAYDHVQKAILCGSVYLGYDIFECPDCGEESILPHKCKSRLCPSCGIKSTALRAVRISSLCLETKHRHVVFTIPKEIRDYFIRDRSLLNLLFIAARNTMCSVFNDTKYRKAKNTKVFKYKKKPKSKYMYKDPTDSIDIGAIATLHTFGRDLKWNPHIHLLICEEGYDKKNKRLKNFNFMSYEKLRRTWQYLVLKLLREEVQVPALDRLCNTFYKNYKNGFYVYAKQSKKEQDEDDIEDCIRYITRYTGRPIMAESRIVSYTNKTKEIHWFYNDHETDERVDVKQHVHQFLVDVVKHCPDENFKMVRYYGFYSNKSKSFDEVSSLVGKKRKRELQNKKQRNATI